MSVTLSDLLALPALAGARLSPPGADTELEIDGIAPPGGELPAGSWLVIDGGERAATASGTTGGGP